MDFPVQVPKGIRVKDVCALVEDKLVVGKVFGTSPERHMSK